MDEYRNEIRLMGAQLSVGETAREPCPRCGKREPTLTVTRDDEGLVWNCYTMSCPVRGRDGGRTFVRTRKPTPKSTRYEGELHELTEDWREYLCDTLGFDSEHLDRALPRLAEHNRVAYPVISPLGRRRGWVLRSYDGREPKALTRMDEEEPHTSWYPQSKWARGTTVWLVEDIPSAVRQSRYTDTIALCGSGASVAAVDEIAAHYRNVVWALDADATAQAINQARKYGIYFESCKVRTLDKDIKDMCEEELKCLNGIS